MIFEFVNWYSSLRKICTCFSIYLWNILFLSIGNNGYLTILWLINPKCCHYFFVVAAIIPTWAIRSSFMLATVSFYMFHHFWVYLNNFLLSRTRRHSSSSYISHFSFLESAVSPRHHGYFHQRIWLLDIWLDIRFHCF